MRRRHAVLPCAVALIVGGLSGIAVWGGWGATTGATQATTAAGTPEPTQCRVEPRSLASLLSLAATPSAAEPRPELPTPPAGLDGGERPDPETVTAIRTTLREVDACFAAGVFLRGLALFSDGYVRRAYAGADPAFVAGLATPVPGGYRLPIGPVRDEDLRVLPDGRVGARLFPPPEATVEPVGPGATAGFTEGYIVFVEARGRWLIDELEPVGAYVSEEITAIAPTPEAATVPAVDAVLANAAGRLGVGSEELTVVRVEPQEWPDTSLGCPQPDMMYAQVITPGYLVVVSGAGTELEYHTDATGQQVVLCEQR